MAGFVNRVQGWLVIHMTSFFSNPTRQFPEQGFSGIASLLMSLYRHPWHISKSTPRLPCGGDTLPVTTAGCVGCLQFGGCLIDGRRSWSGFFALTMLIRMATGVFSFGGRFRR